MQEPSLDLGAFTALSQRAATLGLQGDAAAAQTHIHRRRRALAARLAGGTAALGAPTVAGASHSLHTCVAWLAGRVQEYGLSGS